MMASRSCASTCGEALRHSCKVPGHLLTLLAIIGFRDDRYWPADDVRCLLLMEAHRSRCRCSMAARTRPAHCPWPQHRRMPHCFVLRSVATECQCAREVLCRAQAEQCHALDSAPAPRPTRLCFRATCCYVGPNVLTNALASCSQLYKHGPHLLQASE